MSISGLKLNGRSSNGAEIYYVTHFAMNYSVDQTYWESTDVVHGPYAPGNNTLLINKPIRARYIRIYPQKGM